MSHKSRVQMSRVLCGVYYNQVPLGGGFLLAIQKAAIKMDTCMCCLSNTQAQVGLKNASRMAGSYEM